MAELKLFGKWDLTEVKTSDVGLKRYLNIDPVIMPRSSGRHSNKQFHKSKMNIVERLMNKMQVPGHGCGRVSTVTGVTPESVRIGRSLRASSRPLPASAPPKARRPARISLFE